MTKKIKNPLINVGPDNSLNTLKIIKRFNSIHKKKKILVVKKRKTNLEKKFLSLSTSKFKKLFKWKSQIKLSETIKMTDKIYSNFYRSGKYVNSIMKKQIQVYTNKQ
jgi:hypothetical protein